MQLYTFQLSQWQAVWNKGIPAFDTTVKTGCYWVAPSWDIVVAVKSNRITPDEYTAKYWAWLVDSYHFHPEFWDWLVRQPVLALGCYCAPGKFCHRHLLVNFISGITEVCYCGELTG